MTTMTLTHGYRCCPRRARARRSQLRTLAIALVALLLMLYGEAWMLEAPHASDAELTAATYAAEVVYGGADDAVSR